MTWIPILTVNEDFVSVDVSASLVLRKLWKSQSNVFKSPVNTVYKLKSFTSHWDAHKLFCCVHLLYSFPKKLQHLGNLYLKWAKINLWTYGVLCLTKSRQTLKGKFSITIIIFKLCKFNVSLWTLCFVSYKKYPYPLMLKVRGQLIGSWPYS